MLEVVANSLNVFHQLKVMSTYNISLEKIFKLSSLVYHIGWFYPIMLENGTISKNILQTTYFFALLQALAYSLDCATNL